MTDSDKLALIDVMEESYTRNNTHTARLARVFVDIASVYSQSAKMIAVDTSHQSAALQAIEIKKNNLLEELCETVLAIQDDYITLLRMIYERRAN